jgi:hypothetical protein
MIYFAVVGFREAATKERTQESRFCAEPPQAK